MPSSSRLIVPLPAAASRPPFGRHCVIGFAEPRHDTRSQGIGAYEDNGEERTLP